MRRLVVLLLSWTMMFFLVGFQDEVGQEHGETTANHVNSTAGSNSAVNQGNGSSNVSSNQQAGENNTNSSSGFTPAQEASREEDGAWKHVSQVTVIPQPELDDVEDNTARFCNISYKAMGFVLVQLSAKKEYVSKCSEDPFNPYRHGYLSYQAERLLHIAGPRLPLEFELISFQLGGTNPMEEGKSYIVGFFLHEGNVFDHGSHLEVIPFDPEKENGRVKFSGKTEALIALGEAHVNDREAYCPILGTAPTPEAYEASYLTRDQDVCDRFAK